MSDFSPALALAERRLAPDRLIRTGIRRLLRVRLREERARTPEEHAAFLDSLRTGPIAESTDAANEQHYELPPTFFRHCLGARLKYSSCYYPTGGESLDEAEEAMLRLTTERAGVTDGMNVLDLGCGWGSVTLWLAEHFPRCQIRSVSNSTPQRRFIEQQCRLRGLTNVKVTTANINTLELDEKFDRIVSVEMFEHMRNYDALFRKVRNWLAPNGHLFVHVFCHKAHAYPFETDGADNWMGQYFFTGGVMPSFDLLPQLAGLPLASWWRVDGTHYERTANHWLANLDAHASTVQPLMVATYGKDARRWLQRWRMFYLACAELFGYRDGSEWFVGHYLFGPAPGGTPETA